MTDTQAKTVELTEAGRRMIAKAVKTVEHFDRDFFGSLGVGIGDFNRQLLALLDGGMKSSGEEA